MANEKKLAEPLNEDGSFTPQTAALIHKHVAEKFTRSCPACGNRNFSLADRLYAPPAMGRGRRVDGSDRFPIVLLTCTNCSHVMSFGARPLGLYGSVEP